MNVQPAEPLNMHEMTTFSGLPAQNFMPTEADKLRAEQQRLEQKAKSKEEKQREARIKFWKRFSLILFLTPLALYISDNRKAKKMATRRAEYVASATSNDARSIAKMAQLNNAQLIDFYHWVLNEECNNDPNESMTIDSFGELFVNAVNIFKQRKVIHFICLLTSDGDMCDCMKFKKGSERRWRTRKRYSVESRI